LFLRGRALAGPLDEACWKRLLSADSWWGVAPILWIATGLLRVFYGGKAASFYARNAAF
jgi:uncharacterized membrane protein